MIKEKISYQHANGKADGIYINAGLGSTLVIFVNGHNGFYNYGMFPYLQQSFYNEGISTYSFNYSHGGIIDDGDFFEDLEKYEQNCMRLEVEDLLSVLEHFNSTGTLSHSKIILLAHSLGGIPAIFGSKKAQEENIVLSGIILVSSVSTLRFWPKEMMESWAANGVVYKKNNRTHQDLPQGFEFLQETMLSETTWNVARALSNLNQPFLIVHGEEDEAVGKEHGQSLFLWVKEKNVKSIFKIIPGATHTYNTRHPFDGVSKEVDELITTCIDWIKKI
ncbi:MAG: alpha/beta hydrolase [Chitinophagaceae bacterium]|nr:alpha/beta hydrolase [Chitinophagaceae bacterium]